MAALEVCRLFFARAGHGQIPAADPAFVHSRYPLFFSFLPGERQPMQHMVASRRTSESPSSGPDVDDLRNEQFTDMTCRIGVVIPCYKVRGHILQVIASIGPEVDRIYVVDDCCPENSGAFVEDNCSDARVAVIRLDRNQGVGGAVMAGYRAAISDDMEIIVKIDGDGQMDPSLLPYFTAPILSGAADYTKGNRFYDLTNISRMPKIRLLGNAALSFLAKFSSGYWNLFDPTNGYTAIHARTAAHLPFDKISNRYFFETDMLFRLNTIQAAVVDVPMDAHYGDEVSNLKIARIFSEFLWKHLRNFAKRIFYNYFLRDLSAASLELVVGTLLTVFGTVYGIIHWIASSHTGKQAALGTIMVAALSIMLGFQLLLAFLTADMGSTPRTALFPRLRPARKDI